MLTDARLQRALTCACALILALSLALCAVADYFAACGRVRDRVLRLHVIANSDSDADQRVKLLVRDAVLSGSEGLFDGSVTAADARTALTPHLASLGACAAAVLKENGMDYGARALLTNEYFPTRTYGDVTLPAGRYTALKLVLGEGKGQNWWCVMFPPLCLPAARPDAGDAYAVFSGEEQKVVSPENGYRVRFKLAELYEGFTAWLAKKTGITF